MDAVQFNRSTPANTLLAFLSGLQTADISGQLKNQAIRCLVDNIACGLLGSTLPWGQIVSAYVLDESSRGEVSIFGSDRTVSPARAALCNGTMIHGFEADDMIPGSMAHPGTVVVPAALAMAEHCNASADRLLLGVIAGYEMLGRLGTAMGVDHSNRGFHTTGIAGAVAAAVAASIVAGHSFELMVQAVGIACSCGAGIKAFVLDGGMTKRLHGGRAAEAGVVACLLAARGFEGPTEAIDGQFGLLEVIGGDRSRASILSDALGENWAIGRVWVKMYTCCAVIHPALQALETMAARENLQLSALRSIRIATTQRAIEQNSDRAPKELFAAQYSMPFCVAVAAAGDIRDPMSFDVTRLGDPAVKAMIERVALYRDPLFDAAYPMRIGARVELEDQSGASHSMTVWGGHGTPEDPCRDDELEVKFRQLASVVMNPDEAEKAYQAIQALKNGAAVKALSTALRRGP